AVDNNWLATQQVIQMKKDISDAKNNLEMLKVIGKWGGIYTKQEGLTTVGLMNGLGEAGINDIKGMLEFLSDPIAGLKGLKELIVNPEVRQQLGDSIFQELDNKIDRMQTALMVGGDEHAVQYGRDLGSLVWDIGSVAIGVGGVAKAGGALAKAGINVSEDVLERMAARNLVKLVEESKRTYVDLTGVLGKRNLNPLVVEGIQLEAIPTRNKAGHVKLFASEMLTDQQIRNYAQKLAPGVPLKEVSPGVYTAMTNDGTKVTLRSVSTSKASTQARWTIDIKNNPTFLTEVTNQTVEIKFR
ncbi:hemagglutinin, partial [Xylella fastidiosa]